MQSKRETLVFLVCFVIIMPGAILFFPLAARATSPAMPDVELIFPAPGTEVVAKRPEIVCRAPAFDSLDNIMVLFDGADVTGIIATTPEGFSFTPVEKLFPGRHVLTVMVTGTNGEPARLEFSFSTRQSESFEEAGTANSLSLAWEKTAEEPDEAIFQNSYKLESNLGHESVAREGPWEMRFTTNLRYLTQNLAVNTPLEKGINLADYLFSGTYQGQSFQARTEVGDVSVSETPNTVNLSRRGGTFAANYKDFKFKTFMVNGDEVFGFKEGLGIGGSSDEHIVGASGEVSLFSDSVRLKTIYAAGGEKGDSFSTYSAGSDKRGNVLGFLLTSRFFGNKLTTEAELDFSHYDADITDEFSYEKDNAWRLGASGAWEAYSYGIVYECLGTDYQVIGNPYLQADKKGGAVNFDVSFPVHSASVLLSTHRDNVDNDDLYATTDTSQGQVQYMFTGFDSLPLGLMYQRSEIESQDEPGYTLPVEHITDAISATVNYLHGPWNFGFQAGFSSQNDKTPQNNDTDAVNYSISSSYCAEYISISPSVSFNRARYEPTGTRTDTCATTLDLRGNLWDRRINYECAGTFSRTESSDHAIKQDGYNTRFRLVYTIPRKIWGISNPSVGFMGCYNATEDYVYNARSRDFTLLLVFSASMPFAV